MLTPGLVLRRAKGLFPSLRKRSGGAQGAFSCVSATRRVFCPWGVGARCLLQHRQETRRSRCGCSRDLQKRGMALAKGSRGEEEEAPLPLLGCWGGFLQNTSRWRSSLQPGRVWAPRHDAGVSAGFPSREQRTQLQTEMFNQEQDKRP